MKDPLIQREKKKITQYDKEALQGIYGIMLAILSFLDNDYLRTLFVEEFLVIVSNDRDEDLFGEYAQITAIPSNIKTRLTSYYQELVQPKERRLHHVDGKE